MKAAPIEEVLLTRLSFKGFEMFYYSKQRPFFSNQFEMGHNLSEAISQTWQMKEEKVILFTRNIYQPIYSKEQRFE